MADAPPCLYSAETIRDRVHALAGDLRRRLPDRPVTVLGILKGAALFVADLARALGEPLALSFVDARSYEGTESTGEVRVGRLEEPAHRGCDVIVADTILDTGYTLQEVVRRVRACGPASVVTCVLFDKPAARETDVAADFVGFTVDDRFLVGYGLDHEGRYRALPYVGALDE